MGNLSDLVFVFAILSFFELMYICLCSYVLTVTNIYHSLVSSICDANYHQ